jgi:cation-transporting ATPase E
MTPNAPSLHGLSSDEVRQRTAAGQVNFTPRPGGRSTLDIIRGNTLTYFNLILGTLFACMMIFGSWRDALFGWIIFINAFIGIFQEMRAKIALDRLTLISTPAAKVIRDGREQEVPVGRVVLGDVLRVTAGDQIVADGRVLVSDNLEVDESLLTGESVPEAKEVGDLLLSGTFVVAGSAVFEATAVGPDAYAQRMTGAGKRYVRLHSELVAGINKFLRIIGLGIIPVGAFLIWAQFRMEADMEAGVTNTVAALVAMVPQGLVLLTSIAFALSALRLAGRNVLTRELPAVEGLARIDVLCIDKTGTITEPHPVFERLELVDSGVADGDVVAVEEGAAAAGGDGAAAAREGAAAAGGDGAPPPSADRMQPLGLQVLGAMAATAASANSTLTAIGAALPAPDGWTVEDSIPFSSARKWSATRFDGRGSWVLGAPEIVGAEAPEAVRTRAAEMAAEGLRVLLLSHTAAPLSDEALPPGLVPIGLVVLSERVRVDAPQTLAYFREQGVQIKVISGDNPATVATIAAKAGILGAHQAVDARALPDDLETLADVMESTTVFGRVNPDQKCAMVEALQRRGHVVAMTGDGVNDVLALKKADMGIAMGTGTAAAQAVSQLVLVDSRFSTLPGVVAEGRRVTANIERVAGLFTNKSVWAAALAIIVAALGINYPILPRHLTVIDSLTIGVPAFFLALAPNPRRFIPGFVYRVGRFVIPTGLLSAATMLASYLLLREFGATVEEARSMDMIIFSVIGLRVISMIERPLRGWRLALVLAMAGVLAIGMSIPLLRDFFAVEFPSWRVVGITAALCVFAWFFVGLGRFISARLSWWREREARLKGGTSPRDMPSPPLSN